MPIPIQASEEHHLSLDRIVDIEIIRDQLYLLHVHKFMGIHPKLLKGAMAGPLLIIYGRFWESGEVPTDWKLADVIPVYKKGMMKDPGNYQPVKSNLNA